MNKREEYFSSLAEISAQRVFIFYYHWRIIRIIYVILQTDNIKPTKLEMMNKKCLFIALFLLACMAVGAAEVKVLKTTPGELSSDMQGMYANVELQLQVSNVGEEECVCVMLLNNGKWKDDGMTMQRLVDMAEGMCFGDAPIDATNGTTTVTLPVVIPIEKQYMTGNDSALYVKAYIMNVRQKTIVTQGQMVKFVPDRNAMKQQMMQAASGFALDIVGNMLSSSGSKALPEGTKTCPKCQGDGICHKCRRIPEEMKNCSCSYGTCMECGGKGYVNKDMFELMLESDGDDSKKQQNGKKGKVKEKDAPAGSSLLDFFGF